MTTTPIPGGFPLTGQTLDQMNAGSALTGVEKFWTKQSNATVTVTALQLFNYVFTSPVSIANGGNGTSSPGLIAGTNIIISGSWPNYTINASGGGGGGGSSNTVQANITAHAGGGIGSATTITVNPNANAIAQLTTCATAGDSCVMSGTSVGAVVDFVHTGAHYCQMFFSGSDTCDGVAGSVGISIYPGTNGSVTRFFCLVSGVWVSGGFYI